MTLSVGASLQYGNLHNRKEDRECWGILFIKVGKKESSNNVQ